jgi:fumarate reductase flavoprotein subunit
VKQVEADVVVVAAGTAGMAATVAAAEKGARVIAFEKAATVGGAGNMARGPFAVESKLQRLRKIALTKEQVFKIHMDYTHWKVDARLVSAFITKSASTIDWLEKMGVEFNDVQCHNRGFNSTWHIIKGPLVPKEIPGTGVIMMKILTDKAKELGAKLYLRTPVKKILKEGGRITGVVAEDESGEEIRAKAKAVIVATGGFGGNPEMIRKYTGWDMEPGPVPTSVGDGIRMAWDVGAAHTEMVMHGGVGGPNGIGELLQVGQAFGQPNLMVNLKGERFVNEEITQTTPFGGNAVAIQKGKTAFMIFDEDTKHYYIEKGLDFPPGILFADPLFILDNFNVELKQALKQAPGIVFVADSVEEIANKTGLNRDNLVKTINEYNQACETGRDEIFYKSAHLLRPVENPKFYVCKLAGTHSLGSLGGIKINYKTEVENKDFDVIPGLYAAGLDANSIYGDTYIFWLPGNTLGFALNSGRMAGENAVEYINSIGN